MLGFGLVVLLALILFLLVEGAWLPSALRSLQTSVRSLLLSLLVLAILIGLVVGGYFVFVRRENPLNVLSRFTQVAARAGVQLDRPPDFIEVIPANWSIESTTQINVDGDTTPDWLVTYRYDRTPFGFNGPIGGVVYELLPDRVPANLATPIPSRPSAFIPYPLLPRPGGASYLSDKRTAVQVYDVQCDGRPELVILGYGAYDDRPTRLSIFEWRGQVDGYRIMTTPQNAALYSEAGLSVENVALRPGPEPRGPINQVITWQRLPDQEAYYARSQIGRRTVYAWSPPLDAGACASWSAPATPPAGPTPLHPLPALTPVPSPIHTLRPVMTSLDFAFGQPAGTLDSSGNPIRGRDWYAVTFPEEAILAYYGPDRVVDFSTPTGNEIRELVDIVATVRAQADPNLLVPVTWRATKESTGNVKDPIIWRLTPLTPPNP